MKHLSERPKDRVKASDFGSQDIGTTSAPQDLTLTNTGSGSLIIASVASQGDYSQTNTCNAPILPGSTCTVTLTFTPTQEGMRIGKLPCSGPHRDGYGVLAS